MMELLQNWLTVPEINHRDRQVALTCINNCSLKGKARTWQHSQSDAPHHSRMSRGRRLAGADRTAQTAAAMNTAPD
jgi:hypothetical protein